MSTNAANLSLPSPPDSHPPRVEEPSFLPDLGQSSVAYEYIRDPQEDGTATFQAWASPPASNPPTSVVPVGAGPSQLTTLLEQPNVFSSSRTSMHQSRMDIAFHRAESPHHSCRYSWCRKSRGSSHKFTSHTPTQVGQVNPSAAQSPTVRPPANTTDQTAGSPRQAPAAPQDEQPPAPHPQMSELAQLVAESEPDSHPNSTWGAPRPQMHPVPRDTIHQTQEFIDLDWLEPPTFTSLQ